MGFSHPQTKQNADIIVAINVYSYLFLLNVYFVEIPKNFEGSEYWAQVLKSNVKFIVQFLKKIMPENRREWKL